MKTKADASGKLVTSWHQIDWNRADQHVRGMQLRIAKPDEGKLSRPVLRGWGLSNETSLPDELCQVRLVK